MTDQQLIDRLRASSESQSESEAVPRGHFVTALGERLVVEYGFRGGHGRLWPVPIPTLRLAMVVVAVALALAAALVVGGRLIGPSPHELVERSMAVYARPPAFRAVVDFGVDGGSRTISSDGSGSWRVDINGSAELAPGASVIWSPLAGGAVWDPLHEAWRPLPVDEPPPYPLQTEIAWAFGGVPGSLTCLDWRAVGDDMVAGRAAIRLHCGDRDQDFWLDRETLLVLKVLAGVATPNWTPGAGISLTEIRIGSLDPALFVASPVADRPGDWPAAVDVGQPIPAWFGVTLDGASAGSASANGRAQVILVWASWCPPCFEGALPFLRSAMGRTDVDVVTIAINDDPERVRAVLATAGLDVPTVVDDGTIQKALGTYAVPTLILIDAAGVVQAFAVAPVDPEVLALAVDTLVQGGAPVLSSPSP